MSKLLINEYPLQVLPSLAVAVGLNEAIIVQQIHYWLGRSTTQIHGHRWVYNSVAQWRGQFPFWSDDTIARALKNLRKSGIVIAEQLSKDPRDRSFFYRIDYSKLPESSGSSAECISAKCGNEDSNLRQSLYRTEITAETPTETPPVVPKGTPEDDVKTKKTRRKTLKTLSEYLETIPEDGYAISPDDLIYERGIPEGFINLAWSVFKDRFTADPNHSAKRYKSWPAAFRQYIDGGFLRLWYSVDGTYQLTTAGQQAQQRFGGAAQ